MTEWCISTSRMMKVRARSNAALRPPAIGLVSVASSADVTATVMLGPACGSSQYCRPQRIQQGALAAIPMAVDGVRQAESVPGINRWQRHDHSAPAGGTFVKGSKLDR